MAGKNLEAKTKTSSSVFHVYDMEQTTTEDEILEAISKMTDKLEEIEITSLRTARSGGKNATIKASGKATEVLATLRHIKIGWISCRIARRSPNQNCTRCWKPGHKHWECKGPDRRLLCFNCAKTGHLRTECQEKPFCPICKKEGHRYNERTCTQ